MLTTTQGPLRTTEKARESKSNNFPQEPQQSKITPRELRRQNFLRRQHIFVQNKNTYPGDVRLGIWLAGRAAAVLARIIMSYGHARLFISAISNGFCTQDDYDERKTRCNYDCDWYHESKAASYCRGCSCPQWKGSELTNKLRLANFRCPLGRFSQARGWWGRIFGAPRVRTRGIIK